MLVPEIHLDRAERELASVRADLKKARRKKRKWKDRALYAGASSKKLASETREARGREVALLLRLEAEVRKAEHHMTAHRYDPRELRSILDTLDCVRCKDVPAPVPVEEAKTEPPPAGEGAQSGPAVRLVPS